MAVTMDRETFLKLAPEYYMLALYIHFQYPREYYTDVGWTEDLSFRDDDADATICYVENAALREEAVRLMLKHGAISVIDDPFGPTIWQKTDYLDKISEQLESSPTSVFFRAKASGDPRSWLFAALQKLNLTADELRVTNDDFASNAVADFTAQTYNTGVKEQPVDEWAPITIDQANPEVAEATKQLNAATEAIEQDNGYSATYPQERDAVVSDLKGGLEKLKSGVVSAGWLRRTAIALKTVSVRFAGTVKGQTIDGAMLALKEVVKSHVGHALEYLWMLLP
jgi:hypothetical protein